MAPVRTTGSRKVKKTPGVTKLADGRWLLLKTWTDPKTGAKKFKRKVFAGTLDEAVEERAKLRSQATRGGAPSKPKFREFADAWLERRKKRGDLQTSTDGRYELDVANLNVSLGHFFVDAIEYDDLEAWQSEMHKMVPVPDSDPPRMRHQYAAATINTWQQVLREILDAAVRKRLLLSNPARELAALPTGRTRGARGTSLEAAQLRRFMDTIPLCIAKEPEEGERRRRRKPSEERTEIAADVARGLYVYGWTGMRAGEIIALDWIHIVDGELHVERSVGRDGVAKVDKTDDPRRITVVEPLVSILEEQRRWLLTTQHPGLASGLVFPGSEQQAKAGAARRKNKGGAGELRWFRSQSTFQEAITIVCKRAEVPRITPHSLRRTFENLTREAGVEALVRRAIHGWRSERTQGIYATVSREERDEAARAVVRLVLG